MVLELQVLQVLQPNISNKLLKQNFKVLKVR